MQNKFTKIVFLDFDGVLHPYASGTFSKLLMFAAWLEAHPHIGVVFSSTWRYEYPLEELREFFPHQVRAQIVGVTPDLMVKQGLILAAPTRSEEIGSWLRENRHVTKWLALDDEPRLFTSLDNVVLTQTSEGLTMHHLATIGNSLI